MENKVYGLGWLWCESFATNLDEVVKFTLVTTTAVSTSAFTVGRV